MLRRMLQAALLAGFLTAIAYSLVQAVAVTPFILHAEAYEDQGAGHAHEDAHGAAGGAAHGHAGGNAAEPWAPEDGFERYASTFLANLVLSVGFAFVLVAAFALRGREVDLRSGVMWGLAGFACFTLAPSLGLAPELPGSAAAELDARQLWYGATVAATAVGLGLVAFARPVWLKALAVPVILAPHLIGAPVPDLADGGGPVPPELAAEFAVWSLAASLLFWAALGGLCAHFYGRSAEARAARAQPA